MNPKTGQITLLGTGASAGSPAIACHCPVCESTDPHNKRLRASALIEVDGKAILIDAGPDLRCQALTHKIDHLDGVIFTHTHYDHTGGIDELRSYYFRAKKPLLCLASEESMKDIQLRFYYIFKERKPNESLTAKLSFQVLEKDRGEANFLGIPFTYMTFSQGGMNVNGFRFGNLAYISDICEYPETIFDDLKGIDTLILSALREDPSPVHFSISQAVQFVEKVKAKQCWLTHISHDQDHNRTNGLLPSNIRVAYDGLKLTFTM